MTEEERHARQEYLARDSALLSLWAEANKSFDRVLLTLSAGAITISVAFLEKLYVGLLPSLMATTWVFWGGSLMLQVVAARISVKTLKEEQVVEGQRYTKNQADLRNKFTGHVTILNELSMVLFILGVISFGIFAISNLMAM